MCHRACIWVYNSELVLDKSSKQIKSLTTRSYTILGYLGQCTLASWHTRPCPLGTLRCAPVCKASISCPFTGKTLPISTSSLFSLYLSLFFLCSCPRGWSLPSRPPFPFNKISHISPVLLCVSHPLCLPGLSVSHPTWAFARQGLSHHICVPTAGMHDRLCWAT